MALFDFDSYEPSGRAWDEMFEARGVTRPHYGAVHDALGTLTADDFRERCVARDRSFRDQGITFSLVRRGAAVPARPACPASSLRRSGTSSRPASRSG